MFEEKIAELKAEIALYEAIKGDYIVQCFPVVNIRTDAVYDMFIQRHPDIKVSQRKFSAILCAGLNLKSVQGWLDGRRGSFYEHR